MKTPLTKGERDTVLRALSFYGESVYKALVEAGTKDGANPRILDDAHRLHDEITGAMAKVGNLRPRR